MTIGSKSGGSAHPVAEDRSAESRQAVGVTELGLTKFLDPLRIPPVIKGAHHQHGNLEIRMQATSVSMHSELPPTPMWTYDGHFPGPTIEVRRGHRLRVVWHNAVSGDFPFTAVESQTTTTGPGRDGAPPVAAVAALPPWLVVHLHGARTGGGNDGWTENAFMPGESQVVEYLNDQEACALWYHDHSMAITSLNVMAGLAGMYVIRDDEEDALHLPSGKYEVPLIICDRNLDTDDSGALTGDLLYKQTILRTEPMKVKLPFTGPYTLVNGVIWPHMNVDARWYRFRLLNTSNLRPYTLELRDEDGELITGALRQIGTDGGLLPAPAELDHLTLPAGVRADVLIDFSALRGKRLTLVNTLAPPVPPGLGALNPDVMQFRVGSKPARDHFTLPSTLSPSFRRLTHDELPHDHEHRWLVLTLLDERHPELWEMVEMHDDDVPAELPVDGIVQVTQANGTVTTLQRVTRTFTDAASFYVDLDAWEQWKILNVSTVGHPMHIHLIKFQALSRERFDVANFSNTVGGTTAPVTYDTPGTLEPGEEGWKDIIEVGPGELVSVAGQFAGGSGRYLHHCHILEHEDEGMMRTFVVMPEAVMALDPHHAEHGAHHDH